MKHSAEQCILVVEDDEPKLKSIIDFLRECLPTGVDIITATSLSSAIRVLSTRHVQLVIVDMSLPTFDLSPELEGGGQPQGFGGADILRFIESETADTKSVVITQYEEFPSSTDGVVRDLRRLENDLSTELGARFLGVIHYAGRQGAWSEALASCLTATNLGMD